jgi:hypothetical protein
MEGGQGRVALRESVSSTRAGPKNHQCCGSRRPSPSPHIEHYHVTIDANIWLISTALPRVRACAHSIRKSPRLKKTPCLPHPQNPTSPPPKKNHLTPL